MTDPTARRPDDAAPEPTAPAASGPSEAVKSEEDKIAELVETLAREAAENKDKLLRALAEMENLRRRTERQVAEAREYSIAGFARDVLAVADNMDRALQALDAESREKAEPGIKALLDGVEITERELIKVLEKHGVRKFEPKGVAPDRYTQSNYEAMNALKIGMEKSGFKGREDTMKLIEALEGLEMKEGDDFPQGDKLLRKEDHQAFLREFIFDVKDGKHRILDVIPKEKTIVPPACKFA